MSDHNSTNNRPVSSTKTFLKKGEGLKRFAAYNPPLPFIPRRRQTYVKFNVPEKKDTERREPLGYIPQDLLLDDSINLSTATPIIPPPKIMHTPLKPRAQKSDPAPRRYNLRGARKTRNECSSSIENLNSKSSDASVPALLDDNTMQEGTYDQNQKSDTPTRPVIKKQVQDPSQNPVACLIALGQHIENIQVSVNELKLQLKNCHCDASTSIGKQTSTRPIRKVAKSKATDKTRPSASADNNTMKSINVLIDEVVKLRERFEYMQLNHDAASSC